ncbi:LURP-one-related [Dillenia turbinata]|uniref:LURP-one-related n=1 Tax=Dillenia turbinata TaxID=194707 RepID=A0AAN8VZZ8_9MAGN
MENKFGTLTAYRRWNVVQGDSSDPKDLLFSAKKASLIQFETELDVFLATTTKEEARDFKVKGSWLERACTIYAGNNVCIGSTMFQSIVLGKDNFGVNSHVDYASIVALEEVNEDRDD